MISIRPLSHIDRDYFQSEICTGYDSLEKYAVQKFENEFQTVITTTLVRLESPHHGDFTEDFNDEDCLRYEEFLRQGKSYGAYDGEKLVAISINEMIFWNNTMRIWEFHVHPDYRQKGIGRLLMDFVCEEARKAGNRLVWLETQNTNVRAIRFYREMGFRLEGIDLSFYTNRDIEQGEVAFFMKRRLDQPA